VPTYPRRSRRLREQGTVLLEMLVLADGRVTELRVNTSSGFERLDQAALDAVQSWRFLPAQRGGEAIAYRYLQPIEFLLVQ
jgi:protein TonB